MSCFICAETSSPRHCTFSAYVHVKSVGNVGRSTCYVYVCRQQTVWFVLVLGSCTRTTAVSVAACLAQCILISSSPPRDYSATFRPASCSHQHSIPTLVCDEVNLHCERELAARDRTSRYRSPLFPSDGEIRGGFMSPMFYQRLGSCVPLDLS